MIDLKERIYSELDKNEYANSLMIFAPIFYSLWFIILPFEARIGMGVFYSIYYFIYKIQKKIFLITASFSIFGNIIGYFLHSYWHPTILMFVMIIYCLYNYNFIRNLRTISGFLLWAGYVSICFYLKVFCPEYMDEKDLTNCFTNECSDKEEYEKTEKENKIQSRKVFILLHDFLYNAKCWNEIIERFGENTKYMAPQLNFNKNISEHSIEVIEIIKQIKKKYEDINFVFVGHGYGSQLIKQISTSPEFPEKSKIILLTHDTGSLNPIIGIIQLVSFWIYSITGAKHWKHGINFSHYNVNEKIELNSDIKAFSGSKDILYTADIKTKILFNTNHTEILNNEDIFKELECL